MNNKLKMFFKLNMLLLTLCSSFFVIACQSTEIVELEEIEYQPLPEEKKIPAVEGMITEIVEKSGEQTSLYIKIGSNKKGIKKDLFGYVFNDVGKTEKVAKFKLTHVYENMSKAKIVELSYPIKPKAIALIEVDPRFEIKENEE